MKRGSAAGTWVESGFVFTSTAGTPVEPDNLHRNWWPLRERLGLGNVRSHDLRHTCVSLLLDLGAPPHVVREIVAHADLGVTMLIYAHASQRRSAPGWGGWTSGCGEAVAVSVAVHRPVRDPPR